MDDRYVAVLGILFLLIIGFLLTKTETFSPIKLKAKNEPNSKAYLPNPRINTSSGMLIDDDNNTQVFPEQFKKGGMWGNILYSRENEVSPGYDITTGYSWDLRPGIEYPNFPRSRWVAKSGDYYYINNRNNGTMNLPNVSD